ncbi:hypothetical protein Tco_0622001 [Tanacetum coccineum]
MRLWVRKDVSSSSKKERLADWLCIEVRCRCNFPSVNICGFGLGSEKLCFSDMGRRIVGMMLVLSMLLVDFPNAFNPVYKQYVRGSRLVVPRYHSVGLEFCLPKPARLVLRDTFCGQPSGCATGLGISTMALFEFGDTMVYIALWQSQREEHTSDWLPCVPDLNLFSVGTSELEQHLIRLEDLRWQRSDIGLVGGRDKALCPTYMLLIVGRDADVMCGSDRDLTFDTSLGMADFCAWSGVIDAAQHKQVKYMTKCADIGYGFLPFSFSSFGELEKDAVTLLKRVRKFSMAQDIGLRSCCTLFLIDWVFLC